MSFSENKIPRHILVAREDAMGDVILAMPVCGLLKKHFPSAKIYFLGRNYTKAVATCCAHIDEFIDYEEWHNKSPESISQLLHDKKIDTVVHLLQERNVIKLCWQAKIKYRVGQGNILKNWWYCNRVVMMSRKKSLLHEAQLNIKLLRGLKIKEKLSKDEIPAYYGLTKIPLLESSYAGLLNKDKFNLIIHPLSNKNAKEWGLDNFHSLINKIDKNKIRIFITGSINEKEVLADWIKNQENVTDLSGKLNTGQLVSFIASVDGLVASSTGPVHIAAAAGLHTLGLYEDRWSKRGDRWGPIGPKADFLQCTDSDMNTITDQMVFNKITGWLNH